MLMANREKARAVVSHGSALALQICPKLFDFLLQYANGYGRADNNEGGADPRVIGDGSG
jgi:hypothetical protein